MFRGSSVYHSRGDDRTIDGVSDGGGAPVALATVVVPNFVTERHAPPGLHYGRILRDEAGEVIGIVRWKDASENERNMR